MGLCDETTAAALINMIPGSLLRENTKRGNIKIEFSTSAGTRKFSVNTVLKRSRKGGVSIEQSAPSDFPRDRIFACGYGAGRRGFGSQDYSGYSLRNSLGTLFDYDTTLQNPELAFRRIEAQKIKLNELTQRIDAVLMLEPGATWIDSSGIRMRGPWGTFMPLGGLGDGFQATLGWIADLFGWAFFYSPDSFINGISGIVLIDELEQHLHPSWQREIIKLLNQQFPKIQFIVSSHAPMCALGTTALPDYMVDITRLHQLEGRVEVAQLAMPNNQRADLVLTSPLFGLFSASGFDVSADIQRYAQLSSKRNRSDAEKAEFIELGERLRAILEPFQNDLERRIDAAVRDVLEKELADALSSGELTNKALGFQIRNHLKKYFGSGRIQ